MCHNLYPIDRESLREQTDESEKEPDEERIAAPADD